MEERRAFAVEANENASADGRQVASSTYSARLGVHPLLDESARGRQARETAARQ